MLITTEMDQVSHVMVNHITSQQQLINLVNQYLAESGGKRIRAMLTILASKVFGYHGDNHIKLASAVELIHIATLLHDDVVDDSVIRRRKPTVNAAWGNKVSILVGDFLFSQSFQLMVSTNSIQALKILSNASTCIIEGEVTEFVKLQEKNIITHDEYNQIIQSKTAQLFAAACTVGGIIANQSEDVYNALWDFGIILGQIFQITDDLLDYYGQEKKFGKNIGSDFLEGKVTLPLILLYDLLPSDDKTALTKMIELDVRLQEDFVKVQGLLYKYNIEYLIFEHLNDLKSQALLSLERINIQNQYIDALISLVDFAIQRSH